MPNGADSTILTAQWISGPFVQANANMPMGRASPPTIAGGRRDSAVADLAWESRA